MLRVGFAVYKSGYVGGAFSVEVEEYRWTAVWRCERGEIPHFLGPAFEVGGEGVIWGEPVRVTWERVFGEGFLLWCEVWVDWFSRWRDPECFWEGDIDLVLSSIWTIRGS